MYNYSGIKPEIVELLSINRFNDSKEFYEEHKEELKQGATIPMRQDCAGFIDLMSELDPLSDLNPVYSVSRIGGIQDEQKVRCSIVKIFGLC